MKLGELNWHFVGIMQHGYEVVNSEVNGNIIYAIKIDNEVASITLMHKINIPNFGEVLEVLLSRTLDKFEDTLLNIKLKHFLIIQLSLSVLCKLNYIAAENLLKNIDRYFEMVLIDVISDKIIEWSYDNYLTLVDKADWQVLLKGNDNPMSETENAVLPGQDPRRYSWTYYNFFEDCK